MNSRDRIQKNNDEKRHYIIHFGVLLTHNRSKKKKVKIIKKNLCKNRESEMKSLIQTKFQYK